ncbi:MAG: integrin alpha, partial [Pseudomonadota bacterium]
MQLNELIRASNVEGSILMPTPCLSRAIKAALAVSPLLLMPQFAGAQNVDLGNLGDRGFLINGSDTNDNSGFSVSGAGDVNGDGLADLIIGAPNGGGTGQGFVVFGKADTTPINLDNLGAGGFRIEGIDVYDTSGFSVAGAGDVNGDG